MDIDREYVKKHFAGDLIRTILMALIFIFVFRFCYSIWEDKQREESLREAHKRNVAELEAIRDAWEQMSPEERFEDFVFGIDENGIVYDVVYDEDNVYIRFGPLDPVKDHKEITEKARSVLDIYSRCAKEEGLNKSVVLIGIDQNENVIWDIR